MVNLNGKKVQKGGDICTCVADSFHCTQKLMYLEGAGGEGGGRGDRDGEDMLTQGLFISMYDRIHYK